MKKFSFCDFFDSSYGNTNTLISSYKRLLGKSYTTLHLAKKLTNYQKIKPKKEKKKKNMHTKQRK